MVNIQMNIRYLLFINGTLLIKGVDIWGNPIEIDITSV